MILTDCHIHTRENADNIVRICNLSPGDSDPFPSLFSVGLHPKLINEKCLEQNIAELEKLLELPECCAVGECGLDTLSPVSMELQKTCFLLQIQLSEKHDLPLILHCVRCWPEIIRMRKESRSIRPWIAHGFRSSPEMARELLKHQIVPSFGPALMVDARNGSVLASIPDNCFLLETDESTVTLEQLYFKAAELRHCSVDRLAETVLANFHRIFR